MISLPESRLKTKCVSAVQEIDLPRTHTFQPFLLFCGNQGLIFQAVRPIDQAADVVNMRIAVGFELHRRHKAAAAALAVNKNRRIERGDLFLRGVFVNGIHREKHGVFGKKRVYRWVELISVQQKGAVYTLTFPSGKLRIVSGKEFVGSDKLVDFFEKEMFFEKRT